MQNVYIVRYEGELGEAEAAFNEKKEILDYWWRNDACWRGEYFSGFLHELGIEIHEGSFPDLRKIFEQRLQEDHG